MTDPTMTEPTSAELLAWADEVEAHPAEGEDLRKKTWVLKALREAAHAPPAGDGDAVRAFEALAVYFDTHDEPGYAAIVREQAAALSAQPQGKMPGREELREQIARKSYERHPARSLDNSEQSVPWDEAAPYYRVEDYEFADAILALLPAAAEPAGDHRPVSNVSPPNGHPGSEDDETPSNVRAIALQEASALARLWTKPSVLQLRVGEMTAQEKRTVIAVLNGLAAAILTIPGARASSQGGGL